MIAQYRPDIAKVAEETIVNLKGVENSLEVLRNDLAWLCQSIGHPEAARLALSPKALMTPQGVTSPYGFLGASTQFPQIAPWAATPFGVQPFGTQAFGVQPYGTQAFGTQPFGIQPNVFTSVPVQAPVQAVPSFVNPYAAITAANPFAVPLTAFR